MSPETSYQTSEENDALSLLRQQAALLLTLAEASAWLDEPAQRLRFSVTQGPRTDTLKKAYQQGRLVAILKGDILVTNREALAVFMSGYVEHGGRAAAKRRKGTK